jgi:hypothetical protein
MTDLQLIKIELRKIKQNLKRGDQRALATRLGVIPNRISDGFDGFSSDLKFLSRLQAEAQKLIGERAQLV